MIVTYSNMGGNLNKERQGIFCIPLSLKSLILDVVISDQPVT